MGGGVALLVSCLFSILNKDVSDSVTLPTLCILNRIIFFFFTMETTGVQMKCSMQEDESVPLFFFHTFIFFAQLPFSRCSESPVKQAFGCWAWPILLVRRWDNFIPEMNETNFVSQNTQGKSTFLEKAWHPLRLALKAVLQRPSCPFPQRLRRCVVSLEA